MIMDVNLNIDNNINNNSNNANDNDNMNVNGGKKRRRRREVRSNSWDLDLPSGEMSLKKCYLVEKMQLVYSVLFLGDLWVIFRSANWITGRYSFQNRSVMK